MLDLVIEVENVYTSILASHRTLITMVAIRFDSTLGILNIGECLVLCWYYVMMTFSAGNTLNSVYVTYTSRTLQIHDAV